MTGTATLMERFFTLRTFMRMRRLSFELVSQTREEPHQVTFDAKDCKAFVQDPRRV
ncbi:hypothetical protein SAMN04515691_2960 [Leifsonia sp. 98AMF]|nr:hypothetical protein SAMN04515690_1056 [Leifsonia sp. 197AMF]SDJ21627.1 hypothetical protein SAMN04515684_2726 [Leifsonia sp. 466MF]SDJ43252.1 hypothetical protein SAMN04515683_0017 [Leifsonia sp. 157MF]SDN43276.1 hypothetical protein SAMN04515686_0910 [Leifsonia sp. 509MF]SEM77072.1 hypothetical protein SAMN04515685_0005 [Leifsonia sp. 467MF]SFM56422.1 hypothetical protein SAMN04515691_2960 [Leifsonia sp. 98AMF]